MSYNRRFVICTRNEELNNESVEDFKGISMQHTIVMLTWECLLTYTGSFVIALYLNCDLFHSFIS